MRDPSGDRRDHGSRLSSVSDSCPDTIVVAGLAGDSGKSLVAIGLIGALRRRGLSVAAFKKGPDFIDAAWLGRAAGAAGRNLDTFLMSEQAVLASLARRADADIAVVEGNRGLFDGMTARGDHATNTLAKLIQAPILLVVDVAKTTRTAAALVKGCQCLDPEVRIGGVVLNRVGTRRQESLIREAIALETGVPVMGAVYRRRGECPLPSRHLGLLTAAEHPDAARALEIATEMVGNSVDVDRIIALARRGTGRPGANERRGAARPVSVSASPGRRHKRIGLLRDRAFSFYYPENLEALEDAGADLVPLSPMDDRVFPGDLDGLYAGGGFPEVHAAALAENAQFRESLRAEIDRGLPVFAECGGLMYLGRSLTTDRGVFPMVGALPLDVRHRRRPEGHGYVRGTIEAEVPFFPKGAVVRGHEFHYSAITSDVSGMRTVLALDRGVGIGNGRDGISVKSVLAFYTHFHALGAPTWAAGFMAALSNRGSA